MINHKGFTTILVMCIFILLMSTLIYRYQVVVFYTRQNEYYQLHNSKFKVLEIVKHKINKTEQTTTHLFNAYGYEVTVTVEVDEETKYADIIITGKLTLHYKIEVDKRSGDYIFVDIV